MEALVFSISESLDEFILDFQLKQDGFDHFLILLFQLSLQLLDLFEVVLDLVLFLLEFFFQ